MEKFYNSLWLSRFIDQHYRNLRPSGIPEEISAIVPPDIWDSMTDDFQKDFEELFNVYFYEQWTATALMAYRVLEKALSIHVEYDLDVDEVRNIGKAVSILQNEGYSDKMINDLQWHRKNRNVYMHGKKRANPKEVQEIISFVVGFALHVYNIKP